MIYLSIFRMKHISSSLTLLFLLVLLTSGCSTADHATERSAPELPHIPEPRSELPLKVDNIVAGADVDIDSLLNSMTLRQKIGQLFVVPAYGSFTPENDLQYSRLKKLVAEHHIGGIIFMQGDIYGQALMTNQLQELASVPLWITQDMEFGAAMRVSGTTRFTPAMGIAATGNPANAYLKGKVTAREAKALGVHQVFAPVLDVNNNPENPVINVRSYSGDPDLVSQFGMYFIAGVESEGVLATAKHFPGHGDTDTDSHLSLPVIYHDYEKINTLELVPFRVAIDNGLRSVMSAHISYPSISENIGRPGTLDESILNRILMDSLQFNGLVVTDGLEMRGITDHYSPGEAVILSLLAGADIMLISPDVQTAMDEVEKAVQIGRISEERIDQSVRKLLQLKKYHHAFNREPIQFNTLNNLINTPEYQAIADDVARQSVTVLKNDKSILPISDASHQRILVVSVADDRSGSTGTSLAREIRKYHSNVTSHVLDSRSSEEEKQKIISDAESADLIIIGSFIMVRSHRPIQMPEEQLEIVKKLITKGKPSALLAFGNPYVIRDLPEADVQVLGWATSAVQVRQTVPAMFGAASVSGILPADIPGHFEIGDGIKMDQTRIRLGSPEEAGLSGIRLMEIDAIMQKAVNDSVFPGGVVGVVKDGVMAWNNGYGYYDYSKTKSVNESVVYDLASVTKVMATTTAIMKLMDEGKIKLTDPVSTFFPEFKNDEKSAITIEHLLLHTSGLPAFKVYVDKYRTRGEILRAIKNEPLEAEPGSKYTYSDLGFILLAEIVEEITNERLDRYIRRTVFYPMGMGSAHFNPKRLGNWMSNRIPPTEIDDIYNRGVVQGVVHDERAFFMDGVAGHAGLFATSADVAAYAQMLLNGGVYAGRRYLSEDIINQFTSRQSPFNNRGFGFDRKSEGFSSAGSLTGPNTFGHLGFTGTSLWVDPDKNLVIILLTNRTYPDRALGREISRIRAEIADAVMKSLINEE